MSENSIFTADLMGPCLLVHCPESVNSDTILSFERESTNWLADNIKVIVLDLKETTVFSNAVYRQFLLFAQELKKKSKFLISYRPSAAIREQLHNAGLDDALGLTDNLGEKLKELERSTAKKVVIDVDFINPFLGAVPKVLDAQAKTKVTAGKPFVQESAPASQCDVVVATQFTSAQFQGIATLGFSKGSILEIYQNMMARAEGEVSGIVADCAKELMNIIFNTAASEMGSKTGHRIKMGEIKVYVGSLPQEKPSKRIVFPFEVTQGKFQLEIALPK